MNLSKTIKQDVLRLWLQAAFEEEHRTLKQKVQAEVDRLINQEYGSVVRKLQEHLTDDELKLISTKNQCIVTLLHANGDRMGDIEDVCIGYDYKQAKEYRQQDYILGLERTWQSSVAFPHDSYSKYIRFGGKDKASQKLAEEIKGYQKKLVAAAKNAESVLNSVRTVKKLQELTDAFDEYLPKDPKKMGALVPIESIEAVNALTKKKAA